MMRISQVLLVVFTILAVACATPYEDTWDDKHTLQRFHDARDSASLKRGECIDAFAEIFESVNHRKMTPAEETKVKKVCHTKIPWPAMPVECGWPGEKDE